MHPISIVIYTNLHGIQKLTSFSCKWIFVNLRYPIGAISSLEFTIVSYSSLRHKTKWNKKKLFRLYIHTYITHKREHINLHCDTFSKQRAI